MFDFSIPGANAGNSVVYQFTGLDRRARVQDGACRWMVNLSTDDAPCLSPRAGRRRAGEYQNATMLLHKGGKALVVDGTALKYGGEVVGSVTAGRKRVAVMNDWVFLWPDKAAFNVATGELRSMEARTGALAVTFTNAAVTRNDGKAWPFSAGDGVTIEGCVQDYNNRTAVVQAVDGDTMTFYDNVFQYGELGGGTNQTTHSWSESAASFSRTVPDLDHVCEKDNRLWGVYGSHICCCKLGDGFNWNVFNALATDAYDVTVGSDGEFTGIAAFASYVLAFKETCVHKLYGTKPANYTVNTAYISGVQEGCADTLQIYNNVLYYLSRDGVMAYGGGTPEPVGAQLNRSYTRACAGMHGAKYYLCGVRDDGAEILVYDTGKNLWAREDGTEAAGFSSGGGALWLLGADGALWECGTEDPVEWEAVFGPFERVSSAKQKGGRMDLILTGEKGAVLEVSTKSDGGAWRRAWSGAVLREDRTVRVPFLPVRGHGFRVRLRGKGRATLHSINLRFRAGSAR
ncbi:hypothetical protein D7X33_08505 [Butyricicoccus sp. 1XD8-22]|nr:hypothetical protein D7X33_08505 [Butyricicoccus sp. 1XD8-22]